MAEYKTTQYGFKWGSLELERACSDEKKGWVIALIKTKKYPQGIQIYVTKTGKVRFFDYEERCEFLPRGGVNSVGMATEVKQP